MINKAFKFFLKLFILLSVFIVLGTAFFLIWNKHHNSEIWAFKQVQSILVELPAAPIDAVNNSKAVYVSGDVTTNDLLIDSLVDVKVNAIRLSRRVFMYQWDEQISNKNLSADASHYHYQKIWSEELIDSSDFHFKNGHENPTDKLLNSKDFYANQAKVGDFLLSKSLIKSIKFSDKIALSDTNLTALEQKLKRTVTRVNSGTMLCTGDVTKPQVGDICIEMTVVRPQLMSIIGQQFNGKIRPYPSPTDVRVSIIEPGQKNPAQMIDSALKAYEWHSPAPSFKMLIRQTLGF